METAEHREPYESRGSRTDLGAPGGASPPSCARVAPSSADVLPEAAGFLPPAEMSSRGTGSSNPSPSSEESRANLTQTNREEAARRSRFHKGFGNCGLSVPIAFRGFGRI